MSKPWTRMLWFQADNYVCGVKAFPKNGFRIVSKECDAWCWVLDSRAENFGWSLYHYKSNWCILTIQEPLAQEKIHLVWNGTAMELDVALFKMEWMTMKECTSIIPKSSSIRFRLSQGVSNGQMVWFWVFWPELRLQWISFAAKHNNLDNFLSKMWSF